MTDERIPPGLDPRTIRWWADVEEREMRREQKVVEKSLGPMFSNWPYLERTQFAARKNRIMRLRIIATRIENGIDRTSST